MLVLASQSPRRKEMLDRAGIPAIVRVSGVPEQKNVGETPEEYVRRLARLKAETVPMNPGEIVLGADTVVVADDHILEKPSDNADATRMLRMLSGREHAVITGIWIRCTAGGISDAAQTLVHFAELSEVEIESYVASGEPLDKAGAYAIQGLASKFIRRIEGDYCNVVGLPICLVYNHLKGIGGVAYNFPPG